MFDVRASVKRPRSVWGDAMPTGREIKGASNGRSRGDSVALMGSLRAPRRLRGVVLVGNGMSIDVLIQPPATWQPFIHPAPKPLPKTKPWQEPELDWADLAGDRRWAEAIVAYLETNGKTLLWRVINTVVAESRPATRSLGRSATREALSAMMQLIRQSRVKRHRRRWVTALDADS
jgi:pimeloyl-ACP methyl ester carboxylesterase